MLSPHRLWPLISLSQLTYAISFFTNTTLPANLTTSCQNALLADVEQCPFSAGRFVPGSYYPASVLERACTSACSNDLEQYESKVKTSCQGQTWAGYDDENDAPLDMIPNVLRFNRDLACIMDSDRYCNIVAQAAAIQADPGQSPIGWDDVAPNVTSSGPCDLCFIKNLKKQAESPYYHGEQLQSSSIYESKTSSCSVSGYPLTKSTLPWSLPSAPSATSTPSVCAGKTYSLKAGDDCYSVSKTNGIGTAWLLSDNGLAAYCSDFPKDGTLCLNNPCKTYTVKPADTCDTIVDSNNITMAQLKAWNPIINAGCYNLYKMNETSICISSPGEPYVVPSGLPPLAPSTATTAAPVPTNAKDESNRNCGEWYNVEAGDFCNLVTMRYGISLEDFVFLNPSINVNCTNLLLDISYCVEPVGDINTYSGRPDYRPTGTTGIPKTKYTFQPVSTTSSWAPAFSEAPLASDTRDECITYFDGKSMAETSIEGTTFRHQCDLAAAVFGVTLNELLVWNPSLGNDTEAKSCSFTANTRYCGKAYKDSLPSEGDVPTFSLPIREGYDVNCTEFGDVPQGWTCNDVLSTYGLTIAQFFAMNPAVNADCGNLWTSQAYCIASPNVPIATPSPSGTVTASPSSTSKIGPGAPTHTGQPNNCIRWHTVVEGDDCRSVADKYFITMDQFFAWNPAVSKDCTTNFWKDQAYCVGTSDSISVSRSTNPTPTPTGTFVMPTPNQANNAVSNCNKAAQAKEGEYCSLFAEHNSISTAQLFAWNKVFDNGNACDTAFWKDYWYCVGVSTGSFVE